MVKCYKKDYPRPQFVRDNWENLNGSWDFCFDDGNVGEKEQWFQEFKGDRKIQVPFTYITKLSGIEEDAHHDVVWYGRTIEVDAEKLAENNYILHFEGSDFITKLWVNGQYAGSHRGGYARFSFDITNLVKDGTNRLVVRVEDSYDMQQPRGKQRWTDKNFGCWYEDTTGIWKTVWSEYVPKISLNYVKMTPDVTEYALDLEYQVDAPDCALGADLEVETIISFDGHVINKSRASFIDRRIVSTINVFVNGVDGMVWGHHNWTPNEPNLYDIEFRLWKNDKVIDEIGSYFAMREIQIDGSNILLNGAPLYQSLILDQGYWKDSHLTPPSEEALIEDIDKIHALGYNGLRKHQKIEDERFLYWCDVKGMLVWSEMAAAYRFSDDAVQEFTTEWMEIVRQNYNHPCIITWTPFNESWGVRKIRDRSVEQHFTEAVYYLTKSFDKKRPVVANDGWEHTVSDILTLHDYEPDGEVIKQRYTNFEEEIKHNQISFNGFMFALANGYEYKGQPVIISEYGGIAFDNDDSGWGYGDKVTNEEAFIKRFDCVTTAIKELPYVCGYCYTQVTDVQQEINGLMDMERNFKVNADAIKEINERPVGRYRKVVR